LVFQWAGVAEFATNRVHPSPDLEFLCYFLFSRKESK
jgi:hypothetical protein